MVDSEPNRSDHCLGTRIQVTLNDKFHHGRGYVSFMVTGQNKAVNGFTYQVCWWDARWVSHSKAGKSFVWSKKSLSFRVGGGYSSAKLKETFQEPYLTVT